MNGNVLTLGEGVTLPLSKLPHVLVAGMTGSGKSWALHSYIRQLISLDPNWSKLVLIDPKHVEFSRLNGLPHLIWPVASEVEDIAIALSWAESEMRFRFHDMGKAGYTTLLEYPDRWAEVVVIIDELANIMLMGGKAGKDLERRIVTIASMGRAAGVHLILATQRPSADVITGLIRANVPTRVALPVITKMESRIILDVPGAEELQNPGDMLIRLPGRRDLIRTKGLNPYA